VFVSLGLVGRCPRNDAGGALASGADEEQDVAHVREVAMSTRVSQALFSHLGELRHEPTAKRVRALLGDDVVADTTAALLVWEPRRVVPTYAVPLADICVALVGVPQDSVPEPAEEIGLRLPAVSDRPVLDPSIPFVVHTTDGEPVELHVGSGRPVGLGFRPTDRDLADHVILDFAGFDWLEEEERIVGHPRDPFHRIDVLSSSRHVRLELDGQVLAQSVRAHLLFESLLPVRFYLPREDLTVDLRPSTKRTWCAYKGEASYWSPDLAGTEVPDLAWSYEAPLQDAVGVKGLVAFFDERVDVVLDGQRRDRPVTPWS
jgi:uncharacterized protein (DUF427 family)